MKLVVLGNSGEMFGHRISLVDNQGNVIQRVQNFKLEFDVAEDSPVVQLTIKDPTFVVEYRKNDGTLFIPASEDVKNSISKRKQERLQKE